MSYSRWGSRGSGYWYTYWHCPNDETENRDTAIFAVCGVKEFTAKELRDDLDSCMDKIKKLEPNGDTEELKKYAKEFLSDVDEDYTYTTNVVEGETPAQFTQHICLMNSGYY